MIRLLCLLHIQLDFEIGELCVHQKCPAMNVTLLPSSIPFRAQEQTLSHLHMF